MKLYWQHRKFSLQSIMFSILFLSFIHVHSIYAQTKSKRLSPSKKKLITKKKKKEKEKNQKKPFRGYETGYGYVDDQLEEKSKYFKITYNISAKDTFALILKRLTKSGVRINARTPSVRLMKNANPHIKNWELLPLAKKLQSTLQRKMLLLNVSHTILSCMTFKRKEKESHLRSVLVTTLFIWHQVVVIHKLTQKMMLISPRQ